MACVTNDDTPASNAIINRIIAVEQQVATLRSAVDSKASTSVTDAITKRIDDALKNNTSANTNSYSKTETYTRAEVDSAVSAAISSLRNELKNEIKASSSTTSTGTTTTGSTVGTVSVITTPTNVQILGNSQLCYTVKVQNTMPNWVYIRPIITINAGTGQSPTTVTAVTITVGGSAGNLTAGNFQYTPTLPTGTTVASITAIPVSGASSNGEFQIAANTTIDLLICIQITAANPIIWNIGTSVNSRTL